MSTTPIGARRRSTRVNIPGARHVSIDSDLSLAEGPGRHPPPDPEETARRLGALGIGDRHFVVAYDDAGGATGARLWWMLRACGHNRVAVLDGGIQAWEDAGGELDTAETSWPAAQLTVRGERPTVHREQLSAQLGEVTLIDARAAERYSGEVEPVDPKAGHIPTAVNVPFSGNLGPGGSFLPASELWIRYAAAGIDTAEGSVVYCGSGVTACHDILAMEIAGLGTASLYPGSWSDWAGSGGPVATGPKPGECH